jgi:hypothetical protein
MTFREMAEHHGFGHLAVVAPIKPAPIARVESGDVVVIKKDWVHRTVEGHGFDIGYRVFALPLGHRTWT